MAAEKTRRYKHAKTVVALLVIACVLAPIAGTSIWIKNQVTKTDRYVRTVKPLASDPAIQAAIATNVTTTLFENVDVPAKAEEVSGGAPRARSAHVHGEHHQAMSRIGGVPEALGRLGSP